MTIPSNQLSGVVDTRPNSASPEAGAGHGPARADDNRNRTPSVTGLVPVPLRGNSDQGVTRGAGGQATPSGRTYGANSREELRLEAIAAAIRQSLQVDRGQVITDEVIERRCRNSAMAVAFALEAFDDKDV